MGVIWTYIIMGAFYHSNTWWNHQNFNTRFQIVKINAQVIQNENMKSSYVWCISQNVWVQQKCFWMCSFISSKIFELENIFGTNRFSS
jgi:hypothetical protein